MTFVFIHVTSEGELHGMHLGTLICSVDQGYLKICPLALLDSLISNLIADLEF